MRRSAELLGLDPGVYRVDEIKDCGSYVSASVSQPRKAGLICDACGHRLVVHDYRKTRVYHTPLAGKPCLLTLRKRRYRCSACGRAVDEAQPLLSGTSPHVSRALEEFVLERTACGATASSLVPACGASKDILAKVEEEAALPRPYLPRSLCIDEVKVASWKSAIRSHGPHMACCVYDADKRTLVDMFAGDKRDAPRGYFGGFSQAERDAVESVACDLNGTYIAIAAQAFPSATIYADKFHVSKLVTGAVDKVRVELRRELERAHRGGEESEGAWRAQRGSLHKASKLILARKASLSSRERECAEAAFALAGSYDLRKAYLVLQLYFEWADATYPSREGMQRALKSWTGLAGRSGVPEMGTAASTVKKNVAYILNAREGDFTNATAEALNRRIKDIIRECRGFKGFGALRRRCLLVLGHERTRALPIPLFTRADKEEVEED